LDLNASPTVPATTLNKEMIKVTQGDFDSTVRERNKGFVKPKKETHLRAALQPI